MSADAAPAAATTPSIAIPPAPNTAPTATGAGPRQGLLASMVAPVEPARPTFTLDPAAAAQDPSQGGNDVPAGGVSSAAFHDTTTPADTKTDSTSREGAGKPKQGMIRALVLAAATRWAKGGGTANKRLDMHKARAQADQVKETRQVTVNRSPSTGGGAGTGKGSGAGGGRGPKGSGPKGSGPKGSGPKGSGPGSASGSGGSGGKSLDRKSSGGGTKNSGSTGPSTGPKNSTSPTKGPKNPSAPDKGGSGPSGSSGSSGRGGDTGRIGGGGSGGGKNTGGGRTDSATTPKPAKTKDTPESTPKHTAPAPKGSGKTGTGGGAAASGAKGSAGSTGKPGKDGKAAPAPKDPSADGGTNTKDAPASTRIPKQTTTNDKNTTGKNTGDTAKDTKPKPDLTKDQKPKDPTTKDAGSTPDKPDPASKATGDEKQPAGKTTTPAQAVTADASGTPLATQPARETGYRDGTRAGKAAAHVRAYRDGVKDGWADSLAAADHEKALLDEAREDRKNSRDETRESEQPVATVIASSADHHTTTPDGPQPIEITGIDANNLHLGDGAARTTISRGEVRTLKQFERRLTDRLTTLQTTADTTKQLQAHAEGQAQQAQNLLEQAKGVKGGDKLATALSRLTEDAKKQAAEAGEIHKRAVRSADACAAVLANVSTRYGGMYQAVVDSPETIPAELAYYQGA
ncbi:hypothetical protein [Streptomyces sp. or20]|uniref:hypothetical protein n=1 Tax=Streptomyces sp. or20 TaxID=1828016 RepID=UPI000BF189E8|nr:hypothetical protein [Streptomyces sp. or20]